MTPIKEPFSHPNFLEANEAPIVFNPKDLEEVVVLTAHGKLKKEEISLFLETGKLSKRNY
jgi:hypothetical protein